MAAARLAPPLGPGSIPGFGLAYLRTGMVAAPSRGDASGPGLAYPLAARPGWLGDARPARPVYSPSSFCWRAMMASAPDMGL
jgi:hypothetical protein